MSAAPITRALVLWCPDWPVSATVRDRGVAVDAPVALVDHGRVFACSAAARRGGVRRGLRLREAQARCPEVITFPYDAALDNRAFEPVIAAVEAVVPAVQLLRPGTCVIRSRGPSRYYGSEEEAALWLLDVLDGQGVRDSRVGIADGPFAAERAARGTARSHGSRIRIVPEGGSAAFLSPLPVGLLDAPELVALLRRLGVHTLGDFAALAADDVLGRFGAAGAHAHALAAGRDSSAVTPRSVPEEFGCTVEFEPPLDRIDRVAFGFRAAAGRFLEKLTSAGLVCTAIRIEVASDSGEAVGRSWLHPRSFTAADVVDRVRWQLQGGDQADGAPRAPVTRVRVLPESVDAIANHEEGLWGTGPDERVHHALSRVQSMLGHDGVLTAVIGGGRVLVDRQNLVPWGDRPTRMREARPWPGRLPPPAPATVFETPRPVRVLAADGDTVRSDGHGMLSAQPAQFSASGAGGGLRTVSAWAGPWPIEERWWDAESARAVNRLQIVDSSGTAWLLVLDGDHWWAEARYD